MQLNAIGKICLALILVLAFVIYKDHTEARLEKEAAERFATVEAASLDRWPDALLEGALPAIRQETRVVSARWERKPPRDGSVPKLVATVKNTGSNMTGFADYLCLALSEAKVTGTWVDIQDIDNQPATLGFTYCPE